MNKKNFIEASALIYQEFYRSLTFDSTYVLPLNQANLNSIERFYEFASEKHKNTSLGAEFLMDFIELSFAWWHDRENLKYGLASIKPSWIFSSKSIERYQKLSSEKWKSRYFMRKMSGAVKHQIRTKINKVITGQYEASKNLFMNVSPMEEFEKKRFYNSPEGLIWCSSTTTLFNEKSELCRGCVNRMRCDKVLKDNLPKIHEARYGKRIERRVSTRTF